CGEGEEGEGEHRAEQAAPEAGRAAHEEAHSPGDDRESRREDGTPAQRGDEDRVVGRGAHAEPSFFCSRSRATAAALSLGSASGSDAASSGSKRATTAASAASASMLCATDSMALRRLSGASVTIVQTTRPST